MDITINLPQKKIKVSLQQATTVDEDMDHLASGETLVVQEATELNLAEAITKCPCTKTTDGFTPTIDPEELAYIDLGYNYLVLPEDLYQKLNALGVNIPKGTIYDLQEACLTRLNQIIPNEPYPFGFDVDNDEDDGGDQEVLPDHDEHPELYKHVFECVIDGGLCGTFQNMTLSWIKALEGALDGTLPYFVQQAQPGSYSEQPGCFYYFPECKPEEMKTFLA